MYTPLARLIGSLVALALALAAIRRDAPLGWMLLLVPVLLAWGYVRYGTLVLAFRAYQQRDWPRMERLLRQVRWPGRLRPQDRAYYELLSGVAAHRHGEMQAARAHLAAVVPEELRTDNVRSLLEYHRSRAALTAGAPAAAREHLAAARRWPHGPEVDGLLTALAAEIETVS